MAYANIISKHITEIRAARREAAPIRTQVVARIADTLFYEINSFTYTNLTYDLTVSASGQVESCNCPDYRFRKASRPNGCKHMRALQAQINAEKKQAQEKKHQAEHDAAFNAYYANLEQQRVAARQVGGWSLLK